MKLEIDRERGREVRRGGELEDKKRKKGWNGRRGEGGRERAGSLFLTVPIQFARHAESLLSLSSALTEKAVTSHGGHMVTISNTVYL